MSTPAKACLRALADATLRWPGRRRSSDGIMGDARHQARKSDHNFGNAFDVSHDVASGCDGAEVAKLALLDPRTDHVIWSRQSWNVRRGDTAWRPYLGANPHTSHVHVSVRAEAREDDRPWPWHPDWTPYEG